MMHWNLIFLVQVLTTMHPKFDLTKVQTHNLQIIDSIFSIPEILILITELSGTLWVIHGHSAAIISQKHVFHHNFLITPHD